MLVALRDIAHHIDLAIRFTVGFHYEAFVADPRTVYAVNFVEGESVEQHANRGEVLALLRLALSNSIAKVRNFRTLRLTPFPNWVG